MSEPPAAAARERWTYLGLAALLALVWLSSLAARPLFNPDEGRYAEIPREMLSGGNWVIPHLNGLAYIEKPPLQYWATALSYRLLGVSPFAARLYTALTAFGTIFVVWLVARRLWGASAGWRAAAALSGMLMFVVLGQLLTLDMSLTFYMTLSVAGFVLAQSAGRRGAAAAASAVGARAAPGTASDAKSTAGRGWMLLAWAAAALGVLTKGLVAAVLPAAVLILYSLWSRDFAPWRRLYAAWGLPLFLAITVPWHWLAAQRLTDFLQFFFVHEHFARYLTPSADREEPWWYFAGVFLAGSVPWTLSVLRVLVSGWRRRRAGAEDTAQAGEFRPTLFLWIWVIFVCVFFSLSDSKLMPYILPAMPALALLIAALPAAALRRDFVRTAVLTVIAGLALGVASLNWAAVIASSDRSRYFLPLGKPLLQIAAVLTVSGAFVLVQRARDEGVVDLRLRLHVRDATRAGVFLGVGWCLAWLLLIRAAALVAPIYSGVDLAKALPTGERDAPFYSVGTYDQSLTFYLRRTVTLVAYRGELGYGLRRKPDAEITSVPEFLRLWSAQTRAYAVMEMSMFDDLKSHGVPMRVLARDVQRILVARQ